MHTEPVQKFASSGTMDKIHGHHTHLTNYCKIYKYLIYLHLHQRFYWFHQEG